MTELLTLHEIQTRFDHEWVLIEDPEVDADFEIVRGRVLYHSKDRDAVYQKAIELRPTRPAFIYTGDIPAGTAVVL